MTSTDMAAAPGAQSEDPCRQGRAETTATTTQSRPAHPRAQHLAALAALAAAATAALALTGPDGPLVMAKLATNHNEAAAREPAVDTRRSRRRVREALVALALVTAPLGALPAGSAHAAGGSCPAFMCGSDSNHNEAAARGRLS